MSDLFEDLDNFTKKLDEGAPPKKLSPKKASGSANKQTEITYDLEDKEFESMISGQKPAT